MGLYLFYFDPLFFTMAPSSWIESIDIGPSNCRPVGCFDWKVANHLTGRPPHTSAGHWQSPSSFLLSFLSWFLFGNFSVRLSTKRVLTHYRIPQDIRSVQGATRRTNKVACFWPETNTNGQRLPVDGVLPTGSNFRRKTTKKTNGK